MTMATAPIKVLQLQLQLFLLLRSYDHAVSPECGSVDEVGGPTLVSQPKLSKLARAGLAYSIKSETLV